MHIQREPRKVANEAEMMYRYRPMFDESRDEDCLAAKPEHDFS